MASSGHEAPSDLVAPAFEGLNPVGPSRNTRFARQSAALPGHASAREALVSDNDPLWYKDAILYEVHVRAFQDSDGDGIGDFRGLLRRLDNLQDLGVTAIWLLPFYYRGSAPSSLGFAAWTTELSRPPACVRETQSTRQ